MQPNVFIGSSQEALKYARAIEESLKKQCRVTVWEKKGVFAASNFTLESLLEFTEQFDYGIFVMTADDFVKKRRETSRAARDNVIFEAGLFLGALGRANCFLLVSRAKNFRMPSDLKGLTYIPFEEKRGRLSLKQALSLMETPCSLLRDRCRQSKAWALNGKWIQTWFVDSENFPKENRSEAEVAVFGSRLRATWDVKESRYQLVARISDRRMITGFWRGPTLDSYHGSCQLAVAPDASSIKGKWVGFRSNNEVEAERWEFSRH